MEEKDVKKGGGGEGGIIKELLVYLNIRGKNSTIILILDNSDLLEYWIS